MKYAIYKIKRAIRKMFYTEGPTLLSLHISTTTNGGWIKRMTINKRLDEYKIS